MNDIERAIIYIESTKLDASVRHPSDAVIEHYDLAIQALQEKLERKKEPQPLAPEQLKQMDGEPLKHWVWIENLVDPNETAYYQNKSAYYQTHSDYTEGEAFCFGYPGMGYALEYEDYGKTWFAYTHKPERDGE